MRAVVMTDSGGPDVLEVRDVPLPEPGTGEVRVRVASSGLNRADLIQRRGGYPAPPGAPQDILGLEYAGVVEAIGPGVSGVAEGDRVMGLVAGGGYAEAVVVHHRTVVPCPSALSSVDAGAIPEAFMTAFDAVFVQADLVVGETLLIHAVGSGVGTAALQLARAAGARTVGTSRTPGKLDAARALGLDASIAGGDRRWQDEILERTDGRGVQVILDLVGAPYVEGNLEAVGVRGRWIVVGVPGGSVSSVDLRALMRKRASITGTVLRARPLEEKAFLARRFEAQVLPLPWGAPVSSSTEELADSADGATLLRPVIDRTYPPEEVGLAHARMEENLNFGKLLIEW